ncbi:hypothetical protein LJC16_00690 [Bacteroidales bacterium OttesenSCG-928-C19]|nr:hypothetical protein [Bacteroidales bacterium OttesenSCG-928-C19]
MQALKKNSIATGLLVGISSTLFIALLVFLSLLIFKIPIEGNIRYFLLAVIPNAIFVRYYIKVLNFYKTGKTLIVILLLTVLPFLFYLICFSNEIVWG